MLLLYITLYIYVHGLSFIMTVKVVDKVLNFLPLHYARIEM